MTAPLFVLNMKRNLQKGEATFSRSSVEILMKHVDNQDKRIAELEAVLREVVTGIEFDELGLGTLNDKIRNLLVKGDAS
jgi:hypothetical protein